MKLINIGLARTGTTSHKIALKKLDYAPVYHTFDLFTNTEHIFTEYVESVKAFVPPERLLVYSVTKGWDPLCNFLEAEIPAEPFPRANTRGSFVDMVTRAESRKNY